MPVPGFDGSVSIRTISEKPSRCAVGRGDDDLRQVSIGLLEPDEVVERPAEGPRFYACEEHAAGAGPAKPLANRSAVHM